jgi:uncharacterized protein (TIGR02444 family)
MWQKNRQTSAGEALWRFSLAFYARPGIAAALLALQERAAGNVNLVLFAMWLGATRVCPLDAGMLSAAEAAIAEIDTAVVLPLRRLRRELKMAGDPAIRGLRQKILALEITAERQVQHRLAATAATPVRDADGDALAVAEANLALFLGPEANSPEASILRGSLADMMRLPPAAAR